MDFFNEYNYANPMAAAARKEPRYANAFDYSAVISSALDFGSSIAGGAYTYKSAKEAAQAQGKLASSQAQAAEYGYKGALAGGSAALAIKREEALGTERIIKIAAISVGGLAILGIAGYALYKYI